MTYPKEKLQNDQKGQTFIEFILILVLLISISFTLMRGFTSYVGSRWGVMLKLIARPNSSLINFP